MTSLAVLITNGWYRRSPWLFLLIPFELFYRSIIFTRKLVYRLGLIESKVFPVPVIIVGNITVGGTGKTPLVIALTQYLKSKGFSPGVVSRGYTSRAPAYPYAVTANSPPAFSGDEPLLISLRADVPVVIDGNRTRAVNYLLKQYQCDVVISDDGLQHYKLGRDIECVVVDGERELGNGRCLPTGPLREPVSRLETVDFIIRNGRKTEMDNTCTNGMSSYFGEAQSLMTLEATEIKSLSGNSEVLLANWNNSKTVHAVAGIGNPKRFFSSLKKKGFTVYEHIFPDHHQYSENDFNFGDDLPIIMTEKDAVKAKMLDLPESCWYVPVSAILEDEFLKDITQRIQLCAQRKGIEKGGLNVK